MSTLSGLIRWLGTLTAALLVSFLAGAMLCFALGVAFNADLELLGVFGLIAFASVATTGALAVVALTAQRTRVIDRAAFALVGFAAAALVVLVVGNAILRRNLAALAGDLPILVEALVPIATMVLIQWWLVRRRWRRENPA